MLGLGLGFGLGFGLGLGFIVNPGLNLSSGITKTFYL